MPNAKLKWTITTEKDIIRAMRKVWNAGTIPDCILTNRTPLLDRLMKNNRPAPLTYMGVPIVWDTYEDTFGLTQQEKTEMATDHLYKTYFGIDLAKPSKPKKLPPYRTVGVRFIHGHNLLKVYTYRVRKAAKVHLGQEVIVESNPPTGWTKSLAVIVRIDTTPQDNGPFNYLFIEQAVKAL